MDVGGNGSGLPLNNKQRAMLPNKSRGEFTRNPRKDSEVRVQKFAIPFVPSYDKQKAFPAAAAATITLNCS